MRADNGPIALNPAVPDFVPPARAAAVPARRGGARPGAGAPKGNLNGLRHGRRSRFRDLLPQGTDTVALAGRLLAGERRVAERHAATLMRLALLARHRHAYVAAVEEGRPLPQPPLLDLRDLDVAPLLRYMQRVARRAEAERSRRAGVLTPDDPSVDSARALAREIDALVALAASQLDNALRSLPVPAALATLLHAPAAVPCDQTSNQTRDPRPDSLTAPAPPVRIRIRPKPAMTGNLTRPVPAQHRAAPPP